MQVTRKHTQDGITLLITLLLMGVLLGVTTSLINITLKQYQFSNIAYDSEIAFQAANAGMECAQYLDWEGGPNTFRIGTSPTNIECFREQSPDLAGGFLIANGGEQLFQFSWGTPAVCSEISVFKFDGVPIEVRGVDVRPGDPCPAGSECTYIEARGYNVACADINQSPRIVEREYTVLY